MEGVNPSTIWTWNGIGKKRGAWNLAPDAPESQAGFLLNHLIDDLLPAREDGYRYSASDPITGQAAWYDLRVRIRKASEHEAPEHGAPDSEKAHSEPQFPAAKPLPGLAQRQAVLSYGKKFKPGAKA
jgi:hypothetical protein